MATSELLARPNTEPLQIVSYVDHEFISPSDKKLSDDIADMADCGFNTVVLPVTETDIATKWRQRQLGHIVMALRDAGMAVWGDPWGVGGTFGGEGRSEFVASGELSCVCNPRLMDLYYRWVDTTVNAGIQTAFLDEPEMKCDTHRGDERSFLQTTTTYNKQAGLDNVVVFCADERKRDHIVEVAGYDTVDQIGTDPYWPSVFQRWMKEADRKHNVEYWAKFTGNTAQAVNKPGHVWVQTFDVPETNEAMVTEHIEIIRRHMANIAVWGHEGCASVPNFIKPGMVPPKRAWQLAKLALAPALQVAKSTSAL